MRPTSTRQRLFRLGVAIAGLLPVAWLALSPAAGQASGPTVRLVGTYKSIHGQYKTIQAAVNASRPGDWILVAPGDYHERQDYPYNSLAFGRLDQHAEPAHPGHEPQHGHRRRDQAGRARMLLEARGPGPRSRRQDEGTTSPGSTQALASRQTT